jgi:peptide/nickel transport system substrate-binding protein
MFRASEGELDPVKRAALFIKMNEMACGDHAVIPVVYRPTVSAVANKLQCDISGWDTNLGNIKDWFREA